MRVMVTISEAGELLAYTAGYRGQPPDIVLPPFVTAVTAALQRLNERPHAPQLVSAVAPAADELPELAELDDEIVELAEPAAQAWRHELAEDLVAAGALTVVTSGVAGRTVPDYAAAAITPPVAAASPTRPPARRRAPARRAAPPPAPPRPPAPVATAEQADQLDQLRGQALQMLDDEQLPEVIADQLGVSVRQVKAWDRGDR